MTKMLRAVLALMLGAAILPFNGQNAQAAAKEIQVYFEGERLTFEDTDPVLIGDRTMVPFRKIFETLGFEVEWVDGSVKKAIGKKDGATLELTIDSNKAMVNGKTIELDVPAQIRNSRTLVPLRFVSENSGYHVYFANDSGTFIVGIGRTEQSADPGVVKQPPAPGPDTSSDAAEPYVAKGRVVNAQGQPIAGAVVFADNTFLYNSNVLGATDENGYFRLGLPEVGATYQMGATYEMKYQGKAYTFSMEPVQDQPFAGNTGAVRNFVLDIATGEVELYSWDYAYPDDDDAPEFDLKQVELRLTPVGKLADGSIGSTVTGFPVYDDGERLKGVPVGTYEVTATWKPKDYPPVPMLVSIRNSDQYQESITFNFDMPLIGHFEFQLEVAFP